MLLRHKRSSLAECLFFGQIIFDPPIKQMVRSSPLRLWLTSWVTSDVFVFLQVQDQTPMKIDYLNICLTHSTGRTIRWRLQFATSAILWTSSLILKLWNSSIWYYYYYYYHHHHRRRHQPHRHRNKIIMTLSEVKRCRTGLNSHKMWLGYARIWRR